MTSLITNRPATTGRQAIPMTMATLPATAPRLILPGSIQIAVPTVQKVIPTAPSSGASRLPVLSAGPRSCRRTTNLVRLAALFRVFLQPQKVTQESCRKASEKCQDGALLSNCDGATELDMGAEQSPNSPVASPGLIVLKPPLIG
jgi:hypothetical protein